MRKKAIELYTEEIKIRGRGLPSVEHISPQLTIEEHVKNFEDRAKVILFKGFADQRIGSTDEEL